eukprot:814961-Prymnesium_polylepis.1
MVLQTPQGPPAPGPGPIFVRIAVSYRYIDCFAKVVLKHETRVSRRTTRAHAVTHPPHRYAGL